MHAIPLAIKEMATDIDHIHILMQHNPMDSNALIVSLLRQHATWQIWKTRGDFLLSCDWKENTFWSDGCFAASIGEVLAQTMQNYIEKQGKED